MDSWVRLILALQPFLIAFFVLCGNKPKDQRHKSTRLQSDSLKDSLKDSQSQKQSRKPSELFSDKTQPAKKNEKRVVEAEGPDAKTSEETVKAEEKQGKVGVVKVEPTQLTAERLSVETQMSMEVVEDETQRGTNEESTKRETLREGDRNKMEQGVREETAPVTGRNSAVRIQNKKEEATASTKQTSITERLATAKVTTSVDTEVHQKQKSSGGSSRKAYKGVVIADRRDLRWSQVPSTQVIQLKNTAKEKVAIKVKCSDNASYKVSPVYALIDGESCQALGITRIDKPAKVDKVVVVVAPLQDENVESPEEVFRSGDLKVDNLIIPMLMKTAA